MFNLINEVHAAINIKARQYVADNIKNPTERDFLLIKGAFLAGSSILLEKQSLEESINFPKDK